MRKKLSLLLSFLLMAVLSSQVVHADLADSPFLRSFGELLSKEVSWPPWGPAAGDTSVAVGSMIFVYIALFAILYSAAHTIPLFQKVPSKNAIMWFTFALAGIAVTSTTFVVDIVNVIGFGTDALSLAGFLLIVLLIIMFARWFGGQAGANIPGAQRLGSYVGDKISDKIGKEGESQEDKDARIAERSEIAELNELKKIESLSQREINDIRNIIKDVEQVIKVLKSGKISRDSYEKVKNIIGEIQPSWRNIVSAGRGIQALSHELGQLEASEYKFVEDAVKKAYGIVEAEQKTKHGGSFRGLKTVTTRQGAFLADAQRKLRDKINLTRNQLNQDVLAANALEPGIVQPFQQAMTAISGGQAQLAIRNLEIAREKLQQLAKILEQLERTDIARIKSDISAEFNDLKQDDKIAQHFRQGLP